MEEQDKGGTEGVTEIPASTAARLLSLLLITRDDDLEGYRRRSIAEDSAVELDRLKATRKVAEVLGATLLSTDEGQWQRLLAAHDLLCSSTIPAAADEVQAVPPSPPPPAPEPFRPPARSPLPPSTPPPAPAPARSALPSSAPPLAPPPGLPRSPLPPSSPPRPGAVQQTTARLADRGGAPGGGKSEFDRTQGVDGVLPAISGDALPFSQRPGQAPPPAATEDKPSVDLGKTADVGAISPLAHLRALPFAKWKEAAEAEAAKEAAAAADRPGSSSPPAGRQPSDAPAAADDSRPPAGHTAPGDDDQAITAQGNVPSPLATAALPFGSGKPAAEPAARRVPELGVEQYASLTVASEVHPDRIADTNQRFGLPDDAARRQVDEAWSKRLSSDAALSDKYEKLLAQYRDWHKGQK